MCIKEIIYSQQSSYIFFKELSISIIEKKLPNQYTVIVGIVGNIFYYFYRLLIPWLCQFIQVANYLQKAIRLILILLHLW